MKVLILVSCIGLFLAGLLLFTCYPEFPVIQTIFTGMFCGMSLPIGFVLIFRVLSNLICAKKSLNQLTQEIIDDFLVHAPRISLFIGDLLVIGLFTSIYQTHPNNYNYSSIINFNSSTKLNFNKKQFTILSNFSFLYAIIINNDKYDIIKNLHPLDWFAKYKYFAYLVTIASFIFLVLYREALVNGDYKIELLMNFQLVIFIFLLNLHFEIIWIYIGVAGMSGYVLYVYVSSMIISNGFPPAVWEFFEITNCVISSLCILIIVYYAILLILFIRRRYWMQSEQGGGIILSPNLQHNNQQTDLILIMQLKQHLHQTKKIWHSTQQKQLCSVCRMLIDQDEEYNILSCSHVFHSECIKEWLSQRVSCPNCRRSQNLL